ncbi:MAG TPA: hypothetical protein VFG04_13620 [Planctomycetaceae bacterium]|nr:hypothetical protein [Planctomycetaceae bacterium]
MATNVYPRDAPIPPGEAWYYELDGRTHGPISWTDLEELLNRSGETALEVRVRKGEDGPWTQFRAPPAAIGSVGAKGSNWESPAWSGEASRPRQSQSPTPRSDVRGLLRSHWDIGVAIVVWILLNVSYLAWPQSHSSERRYLQSLRAIEDEVRDLRSKPTSDAEWHELAKRARATLDPMVSDLKKSASSSEPVKQQLLWAARDLVPRTIGPRTKERDETERRLKEYLDGAERELGP